MENEFNGSPLETDLRNAFGEKLKMYLTLILIAIQNQPDSIFWKDALEFALTKTK
jgi:hypothetical protein